MSPTWLAFVLFAALLVGGIGAAMLYARKQWAVALIVTAGLLRFGLIPFWDAMSKID